MRTVAEFVDQLDQNTEIALVTALGAGHHDARKAAACISIAGPRTEPVAQLAACLTRAISALQEAQAIVQRHGEKRQEP
jgi:hypothetical protein